MSDVLRFQLTGERKFQDTWQEWKAKAKEFGIELAADGSFSGAASGLVSVQGNRVTVTITERPWYVPLAAIEKRLKGLFA